MSVIDQYCRGKEVRFEGKECAFYLPPSEECELLKREATLREIFEKGRCQPFEIIKKEVKKIIFSNYPMFRDESEDIANEVSIRFVKQSLPLKKGATTEALTAFIRRVTVNCIVDKYRQQRSRPQMLRMVMKLNKDEPLAKNEIDETTSRAISLELSFSEQFWFDDMLEALLDRAARESDQKKKLTYKRQELMFFKLIHLRDQGYSKDDAIIELAKQFHRTTRTIYRDLEELEKCLQAYVKTGIAERL